MGTKIYDYLAVERKIIFCFTADKKALDLKNKYFVFEEIGEKDERVQEKLIEQTCSGVLVQDQAHLKTVLNALLEEFDTLKKIKCVTKNFEQFSRRASVQKLALIIERITN